MTADIIPMAPRDLIQGSPEWSAERCGKVTASRVADVIARTKTGWGASRANYMAELMCERLTGIPAVGYVNAPMQWGIDTEAEARAAYSFRTDFVELVGFVRHPRIIWAGASPDGFIEDGGEIQIKAPNTATHIDTLISRVVPAKYITQIQFGLACSGRQWCDYVSYDPRLPEQMNFSANWSERLPIWKLFTWARRRGCWRSFANPRRLLIAERQSDKKAASASGVRRHDGWPHWQRLLA